MLSIGLLIALGGVYYFFLGLAATFVCVALFTSGTGNKSWAWIPATILGVMGVTFLFVENHAASYVIPALFIAGGLFLIIRSLIKSRQV